MKVCKITDCRKPHHGRGYCSMHYKRVKPAPEPKQIRRCDIEGCNEVHVGRGYCAVHYYRWRHYGDPLREVGSKTTPMGEDVPLAPLLSYLHTRGGLADAVHANGVWDETDVDRYEKQIARARRRGGLLDVALADVLAVKGLGTHPAMIWGEDWWTAEISEDSEPLGVAA